MMSTSHWPAVVLVLLVTFPVLLVASADAGGETDQQRRERGLALAAAHCAACHAIGRTDESPTRTNLNTSFRDLHKRFPIKMLVDAASTGTIEGHDEMPAFDFSSTDIIDLLVYIDSLSPERAGKYVTAEREG
jgi:cytochrome c